MSIIKCYECELNIDTDTEELTEIDDKEFCRNCMDIANMETDSEIADHTSAYRLSVL